MTKAPIIGKVKSRLGAKIGKQHSLELYKCFLRDIVETLKKIEEDFIIYYTPGDSLDKLIEIFGEDMRYIPQIGENLGERLFFGLEKARELGYQYAFAIASDIPDITVGYIQEAIESVKTHQLVVGPSNDGGYNLIGYDLRINNPDFYNGIQWGTSNVYMETISRLDGFDVHVLPIWNDFDEVEDLRNNRLNINSYTYRYLIDYGLL